MSGVRRPCTLTAVPGVQAVQLLSSLARLVTQMAFGRAKPHKAA